MILKILSKLLGQSCAVFTVIILTICFVVGLDGKSQNLAIFPAVAFGLFAFSLIFSTANLIWTCNKLNAFIRYIIHLVLTVGSSALLLYKVNGLDGKTILVSETILFVIHGVVFIMLGTLEHKNATKNAEYKGIYQKLKNNERSEK